MNASRLVVASLFVLAACNKSEAPRIEAADDPVLRLAASSAGTPSVVQVTITNQTNATLTYGLLTYEPLYQEGAAPSWPLHEFTRIWSPTAGHVNPLMAGLSLVEGSTAFVVPPLQPGESTTLAVPTNGHTSFSYVAHLTGSNEDFVGASNAGIGGTLQLDRLTLAGGPVSSLGQANGSTIDIQSGNPCARPLMTAAESVNVDFGSPAADWPSNVGGHEFGGDWNSNGAQAVVSSHTEQATGLFWFFDLCPVQGATLRARAQLDTSHLALHDSVSTLVVYFFDAGGVPLKIVEGYALHRPNQRAEVLDAIDIPEQTRRIALAPLSNLAPGESGSPWISNVGYDYAPAATPSAVLATEPFDDYDATTKQPNGWTEVGGDWLVDPTPKHAVLWNPAWSGEPAMTAESTLSRTFSLPTLAAYTTLKAETFVAATFSDPSSWASMSLHFPDGSSFSSDTLSGSNYQFMRIVDAAIPTGASSVTVTLHVFLGPTESSSLSFDDLTLTGYGGGGGQQCPAVLDAAAPSCAGVCSTFGFPPGVVRAQSFVVGTAGMLESVSVYFTTIASAYQLPMGVRIVPAQDPTVAPPDMAIINAGGSVGGNDMIAPVGTGWMNFPLLSPVPVSAGQAFYLVVGYAPVPITSPSSWHYSDSGYPAGRAFNYQQGSWIGAPSSESSLFLTHVAPYVCTDN